MKTGGKIALSAVLLALAGGAYWYFKKRKSTATFTTPTGVQTGTGSGSADNGIRPKPTDSGTTVNPTPATLCKDKNSITFNQPSPCGDCKAGFEKNADGQCVPMSYEPAGNDNSSLLTSAVAKAKSYIANSNALTTLQKSTLTAIVNQGYSNISANLVYVSGLWNKNIIDQSLSSGKSLTGLVLEWTNAQYKLKYGNDSPLKIYNLMGYPAGTSYFDANLTIGHNIPTPKRSEMSYDRYDFDGVFSKN